MQTRLQGGWDSISFLGTFKKKNYIPIYFKQVDVISSYTIKYVIKIDVKHYYNNVIVIHNIAFTIFCVSKIIIFNIFLFPYGPSPSSPKMFFFFLYACPIMYKSLHVTNTTTKYFRGVMRLNIIYGLLYPVPTIKF